MSYIWLDFIHSDDSLKELNEGWYDISPYLFHYNHLPREAAEDVSRKIKEFYFGEKPIQRNVVNEITRVNIPYDYFIRI